MVRLSTHLQVRRHALDVASRWWKRHSRGGWRMIRGTFTITIQRKHAQRKEKFARSELYLLKTIHKMLSKVKGRMKKYVQEARELTPTASFDPRCILPVRTGIMVS